MADDDGLMFIDLACLLKITPETTLEKFGSTINASIYDAAQISGTMKQKGLIDFTAYYPGPNSMTITDAGKALKAEAKSAETLDNLDEEILIQLSGGKRLPLELQSTLNLRPKDLTLRLYKLSKQGYIGYELRNGSVELMLTEQGFLKAKAAKAAAPVDQAPDFAKKGVGKQKIFIIAIWVVVIVVVVALYLKGYLVI